MKTVSLILATLITSLLLSSAVQKINDGTNNTKSITKTTVMDSIVIGKQVWATKNLNVDKFRNGDPIPHAKTNEEWKKAGVNEEPAWCYYNNNPENGEKYGKIYNWYAVDDPRGLAPEGWHIPSDTEWRDITDYLAGKDSVGNFVAGQILAGNKMKSKTGWTEDGNGTNDSGFSALPGGVRVPNGSFQAIGSLGCFWSTTKGFTLDIWTRYLTFSYGDIARLVISYGKGLSVRCIRN